MFVLVHGESFYGKVDQVGDFCYVTTRFFHIQLIPIFPIQTYIMLAGGEENYSSKGVPIGFSIKSILLAWLRAALYISLPVVFIMGMVVSSKSSTLLARALELWFDFVGLISIVILTYYLSYIELPWPWPYRLSLHTPRLILYIALSIVFVAALIRTGEGLGDKPNTVPVGAFLCWLAFVGMLAALVLTYRLSHPSLNRALWMADRLGVSRLEMSKLLYPNRIEEELAARLEDMNRTEAAQDF